ncbi:MAG: class I SAM-dependent methyltransferase, partial [Flavobacterium sp.]
TVRQSIFDIFRFTYKYSLFYVRSRSELPIILNRRNLVNEGVEVGVWKGEFSNFLLSNWKGKVLHSIDPWRTFDDDTYIDDMNISQPEFDKIHDEVQSKLNRFRTRSNIVRNTSINAVQEFTDNSLDFVYLDGRHDYDGIAEDILAWYDKVKIGGIICGHDYLDGIIGKTDFGVKKAVDEFASRRRLQVLVTKKDRYPSWFIVKL